MLVLVGAWMLIQLVGIWFTVANLTFFRDLRRQQQRDGATHESVTILRAYQQREHQRAITLAVFVLMGLETFGQNVLRLVPHPTGGFIFSGLLIVGSLFVSHGAITVWRTWRVRLRETEELAANAAAVPPEKGE